MFERIQQIDRMNHYIFDAYIMCKSEYEKIDLDARLSYDEVVTIRLYKKIERWCLE